MRYFEGRGFMSRVPFSVAIVNWNLDLIIRCLI